MTSAFAKHLRSIQLLTDFCFTTTGCAFEWCTAHSKCPAGKFTKTAGTAAAQPTCEACPDGFVKALPSSSSTKTDFCMSLAGTTRSTSVMSRTSADSQYIFDTPKSPLNGKLKLTAGRQYVYAFCHVYDAHHVHVAQLQIMHATMTPLSNRERTCNGSSHDYDCRNFHGCTSQRSRGFHYVSPFFNVARCHIEY